jgi:4a-hydroxytetrahydrobiopterin dehydratase
MVIVIDRFLVTAEAYQIPTTIVFNKYDLYSEESYDSIVKFIDIYRNIGYKCIKASTITGEGLDEIFYDKNTDMLFAFQQINQCNSVEELSSLPIMKKWWDMMSDIMEHNEDKSPRVCFLEQVFDFKNNIPLWILDESRQIISREFIFADFKEAFEFMTLCAQRAEEIDHHPDWSNSWNKVAVHLSTHSSKGLTALDIQMAKAMDIFALQVQVKR